MWKFKGLFRHTQVCHKADCIFREPSGNLDMALFGSRIVGLVICAILVGAICMSWAFAQDRNGALQLNTQVVTQGVQLANAIEEISMLRTKVTKLEDDVAITKGFGLGLSAILTILKIFEIMIGKQLKNQRSDQFPRT